MTEGIALAERPEAETPPPGVEAIDAPNAPETPEKPGTSPLEVKPSVAADPHHADAHHIHDRVQTEFESDRSYNMIAAQIIAASQAHLAEQQRDKVTLRKRFAILFSALLMLEYIFLVFFILIDAVTPIPADIPDAILQLYITSVFVQTLASMGVMIAFAFVSKEETRIVGLLNQIIKNYQKVSLDQPGDSEKPGGE